MRTLAVLSSTRSAVVKHLDTFVGPEQASLLFTGVRDGNALRRSNFNQRVKWTKVVADMGLVGLHVHDLRHAGNIWASKAGTSTKDLMAR